MKRGIIFIVLLLIPFISAIEITLSKEQYSPTETLQAEITGNFVSFRHENVFIYRQGTPRPMPVISDLIKKNEKYYFYAILPNQKNNFSLKIKDAQYLESGELKTKDVTKNFTIKATNKSVLSINPGFIMADGDFIIKVKSLSETQEITAELEGTDEARTLLLRRGIEKKIKFSTAGVNSDTILKINNYNIPIFITRESVNNISVSEDSELVFIPLELTGTVIPGKDYFFKVILENSGNTNLTNLELSNNLNAITSPSLLKSLKPGERILINITIPITSEIKEDISGEIILESNNSNISLPISLKITEKQEEVDLQGTGVTETLSCSDVGKICLENAECSGEITASLEGSCCLGDCIEKEKTSYNWIIGILLLIVLAVIIWFAYKKIKNRKLKTTKEILKEKSDNFQQRMKGEEISGGIDKV